MQKKKKLFRSDFSEFKMAVMLSSNTLLTCGVIVLLRQIDLIILDYLNFFLFYRVIRAKFPEEHRLFTDENSSVHCLAVLNRDYPDMFVLLYVDKNNDSAVSIVIYSFSQA